jgi:excinuclease UvrABC ATPase subunit
LLKLFESEFERWTREFDCPACNGTGLEAESKAMKTGNKTFGNFLVKIGKQHTKMYLFYKLLQVQELIGGDIVLTAIFDGAKALMFKVGVCEVLLMPVIVDEDNEDLYEGVLVIE